MTCPLPGLLPKSQVLKSVGLSPHPCHTPVLAGEKLKVIPTKFDSTVSEYKPRYQTANKGIVAAMFPVTRDALNQTPPLCADTICKQLLSSLVGVLLGPKVPIVDFSDVIPDGSMSR